MEAFAETNYWISATFLVLVGSCLATFIDPRPYRYNIAVMAVAVVLMLDYMFTRAAGWSKKWVMAAIIIVSIQSWPVLLRQGGASKKPDFATNWMVLTDKLHMSNFANYFYKGNITVFTDSPKYLDKLTVAAWDTGSLGDPPGNVSLFLLPSRPQVNVFYTTVVRWGSYQSAYSVAEDLKKEGIYYVASVREGSLYFESPLEYGTRIINSNRHPKTLFYNYDFPDELAQVNY